MSPGVQVLLMVGPLASYFFALGCWQAGRNPRLVAGPIDAAWLCCGLAGLVALGPIGQGMHHGLASPTARLAVLAILAGLAMLWIARARRRLAIYNIEPPALFAALREALDDLPDAVGANFGRSLRGFEDTKAGRGFTVEFTPGFRAAEVEAHGRGAEAMLETLAPLLRRRLRGRGAGSSSLAWTWFCLSSLTLALPILAFLSSRRGGDALRALLERLR
ncbi:MAG TPA: hypothetical protein VG406_05750 [Isosphaeraceae bacterium]|jgi:hypothetical protein|nr:hypothetical protein [Isosphaeraceae bacterium]